MESFTYKAVDLDEIKNKQTAEETTDTPESTPETPEAPETPEVTEDVDDSKILSWFKNKGKEVESVDDLLKEPEPQVVEKEVELEDHISAYRKYYKETGRSFEDFVKLNRDYDKMEPDQALFEYYASKNPTWSKQEVLAEIESRFGIDDMMDEKEIARIERQKKSEVQAAVSELNSAKEKYSAKLASRELDLSEEEKADYTTYREWKQQQEADLDRQDEASAFFAEKTKELFSSSFEGFGYKVDDKTELTFKPESAEETMKAQMSLVNVIKGFLDESGKIKDPKEFHRRLAAFRNPDSFAKHFYDQGKADQVAELDKRSKNLDLNINDAMPEQKKSGVQMKAVDISKGSVNSGRLVIKSNRT